MSGEGAAEPTIALRDLAWFRLVGIFALSALYVAGFAGPAGPTTSGLFFFAAASLFAASNVAFELWRRAPALERPWVSMPLDVCVVGAIVLLTGGAASPYSVLYLLAISVVAYRFGVRQTLLAGAAHTLSFVGIAWATGGAWGDVVPRVVVFALATGLAGLVAGESSRAAVARVVTRRRLQEATTAEMRFRGIIEAAPDAMVVYAEDGRIVMVNSEAERLLSGERASLVGVQVGSIVPLGSVAGPDAPSDGVVTTELEARRLDGSRFDAEVRVSPVTTEDGLWFTASLRDLTERKRGEEERLMGMERLKELERLRELDSFKTQFINNAAHELGTPLTPLKLQVHLLKTAYGESMTEPQRKSLGILERNVERLHSLVKDVLDVARLQASRLGIQVERTDLNRVVMEAAESFQEQARQAGVRLEVRLSPDLTIEADAHRLTQVLFNLLSNAFKFTPSGGVVVLETERLRDSVVVHVSDTGSGLNPEDATRLFHPFSQVHDPMQRTRSGSGLGLYISKGIVELHEGKIWVESPGPGLGSTFSFALPLERAQARPVARAPAPRDSVVGRARELI